MKVSDVMTKEVISFKPSDRLHQALKVFSENNISGCPVTSRGRLLGVISQSDIVAAIDVHSRIQKENTPLILAAIVSEKYETLKPAIRSLLKHEIRKYMKKEVVTIDAESDLYEAAKLINKHNVERLPVVREGKLAGIVSKSDIVKVLGKLE